MAEVAPAPAPTTAPAKAAKKKRAAKPKTGPGLRELIVAAVTASKDRGGVSLSALKKNLSAGGYDVEKNKARVKAAVRALVDNGTLVHTKGTGASGSFKLGAKKAAPKAKKPATKAVKAKKPAAALKAKTTAAKSTPKKAKKPAGKKTKSPAKKVSKKTSAAKKSPVKRVSKPKTTKAAPKKK